LDASRTKSSFLATMSHELRTPLNAIIGYTELLREESIDLDHPHIRRRLLPDLAKINHAAQHLVWVINDVLDLAKIEAGRAEVHLEDFDLRDMVHALIATIGPAMKKNRNDLRTELQPDLVLVRADKPKLRQSILNLLSNAAKFTHNGAVTLSTRTVDDGLKDWLEISVRDTGIGVAAQKVETLFEAFTQADSTTSKVYGGSGLGLAISRQFCRMMGGDITATSAVGKGSTFTIRVPTRRITTTEPAPTWQGHSGQGHRVLVIDDDPTAHDLLTRILTREGFEVFTASNGGEGLRMAEDILPDVITLDVMMSEMDGWTVLSA
ncbi:MAG: ATP-binding protein, partial [Nannocystaceae bacterium]